MFYTVCISIFWIYGGHKIQFVKIIAGCGGTVIAFLDFFAGVLDSFLKFMVTLAMVYCNYVELYAVCVWTQDSYWMHGRLKLIVII